MNPAINPAKPGTALYRTIARRQILEQLGRNLIGNPNHQYSDGDYELIDGAEEELRRLVAPKRKAKGAK